MRCGKSSSVNNGVPHFASAKVGRAPAWNVKGVPLYEGFCFRSLLEKYLLILVRAFLGIGYVPASRESARSGAICM